MTAAFALAVLLAASPAATPLTGARTWPIDPAQSQVQFSVRAFWFARVRGIFPELAGTLRETAATDGDGFARVDARLAVAGLRMRDAGERGRALGPGFFDAARFAAIGFDSAPFPLAELAAGGSLPGTLDLRGQRRAVTLTLLPSDCPRQPTGCAIRLRGTISRAAFGMRGWRGILSDPVALELQIVLRPVAGTAMPVADGADG